MKRGHCHTQWGSLETHKNIFKKICTPQNWNWKDMGEFLDTKIKSKSNKQFKWTQPPSKLEAVIKSVKKRKNPGQDGYSVEFYHTFKKN